MPNETEVNGVVDGSGYDAGLEELCSAVKKLILAQEYDQCESYLRAAMQQFPHAPHPHNLFGVLLEAKGDRQLALRHFRAAWALDATYAPTRHNLERFGSSASRANWAFHECDCINDDESAYAITRDEWGIGRVVAR